MIKKIILASLIVFVLFFIFFISTCDKDSSYLYKGVTLYHPGVFEFGPITCYVGAK